MSGSGSVPVSVEARHLHDHIVGHISRDATEIEAREKPRRRSSDDPPPPAPPKRKRGRPRKHEVLPPKPLTRIEQQRTQSLDEMRAIPRTEHERWPVWIDPPCQ